MNRWKPWMGWGAAATAVLLILVVVACQAGGNGGSPLPSEPEKINPRDVPIVVTEAYHQQDGKTLKKFIVKEDHEDVEAFWNLERGPHGKGKDWRIDPSYRLTEYKANPNLYYYLLEYPASNGLKTERFKVVKADDGWKTFHRYSKASWEYETQDLEPQLIKGVHDRP